MNYDSRKKKMKINIIRETRLSEVALLPNTKIVPQNIWVILGEIPLDDEDDDLDEFELNPIFEYNSLTGEMEKNDHYLMGAFSTSHFEKVLMTTDAVNLINFAEGSEESMEFIKKLHDIFRELGHEVIIIGATDY
tara:strand:+ start:2468 stop:2872 length:405 start_codon:yes stop_codon:yes gene_type:complete